MKTTLLLLAAIISPLVAAPTTSDTFNRTATNGWGSTPQSQAYTTSGGSASDYSVASDRGAILLSTANNRLARLSLGLTHVEGTVSLALSAVPTGGSAHVGPAIRIQSSGSDYYYARLRHYANGNVTLTLQKIIAGSQTSLGSEVTVGTGYSAAAFYQVRFSVAGTNPTYFRAKAWPAGAPEPALWQTEITDSTTTLQAAGGVGIRAGGYTGFAPLNSSYLADDFQIHDVTFVSDLKTAMQNAVAGDILYFTGTHTGNMKTYAHGTATAPIIVRGINATIQTASQSTGYGIEVLHDYWRFDDFTINYAKKGFYCFDADHGVVTRVDITNIGQEAFKWRRYSNYWEVVSCTVDGTGQTASDYGEGFYLGDAQANWANSTQPDTTGYITLRDCYTVNTANDGYDTKEGVHHVKFINCIADFSGTEPPNNHARGDAGFSLRSDNLQLIGCQVLELGNGAAAFKVANLSANGTDYGNTIEFKATTGLNITNGGALFEIQSANSNDIVIYSDYTATNVANFKVGSGSYTTGTPANFVEMTW